MKVAYCSVLSVLLVLSTSQSVRAEDLPDPVTCGAEFKKIPVKLKHRGDGLYIPNQTFDVTLKFSKAAFNYASDFDIDTQGVTVDGRTMRNAWKTGVWQKIVAWDGELDCSKPKAYLACVSSLRGMLTRLDGATDGLIGSRDAAEQRDRRALACATSITLSFLFKTMNIHDLGRHVSEVGSSPLTRLSEYQVSAVVSRLEALKAHDVAHAVESRQRKSDAPAVLSPASE